MRNINLSFHLWPRELYQIFFCYYFIQSGKSKAGRTKKFKDSHEFQRRRLQRSFNIFISEKIGYSGEPFRSGNEEWMCSKPTTPSESSKKTTSFREDFTSDKSGYSGERFRSENEEWMYSKPTTPLKSLKTTMSFREDFISEKIRYSGECF